MGTLEFLLEKGADPNPKNEHGKSALTFAKCLSDQNKRAEACNLLGKFETAEASASNAKPWIPFKGGPVETKSPSEVRRRLASPEGHNDGLPKFALVSAGILIVGFFAHRIIKRWTAKPRPTAQTPEDMV